MIEIDDRVGLKGERLEQLERVLAGHVTLEDAVRSGLAARPRRLVTDVIAQDELSRDIVVAFPDELYVAYEATLHGAVDSVSVWGHRPSATELLERRVARGWRPTATRLQGGSRVLGFAACLAASA